MNHKIGGEENARKKKKTKMEKMEELIEEREKRQEVMGIKRRKGLIYRDEGDSGQSRSLIDPIMSLRVLHI